MWALVVVSCVLHSNDDCVSQKKYYQTEQQCGEAVAALEDKLGAEKPRAKILYFCQEQVQ